MARERQATNDYMSHTDSLNRGMTERLQALINPFPYTTWGENVAAGYQTAAAVFDGWKNSPGHNANMLKDEYNVLGIAKVCAAGTTYGCYWANNFGRVANPATPPATVTGSPTATPTPTPTGAPTSTQTAAPTQSPAPTDGPGVPADGASILLAPLSPGDKNLTLASAENLGLEAGDVIVVNPGGPNEEVQTILGLGPLRTANGMASSHSAGEAIVKIFSGDVNCDGIVDEADTLILLQLVGGLDPAAPCIALTDVNCDGTIGADDALYTLLRNALLISDSGSPTCPEVGGPVPGSTTLDEGVSTPQGGTQP